MTAAQLIEELKRIPAHTPVRCLMETVLCERAAHALETELYWVRHR